jgi:PAS domain S-box-containing protein
MPADQSNRAEPANQARKGPEGHARVFSLLGRQLGSAPSVRRAAEIIAGAADELLGWDCCVLTLYTPEADTLTWVLAIDTFHGDRAEVHNFDRETTPTALLRKVMSEGPQLILREGEPRFTHSLAPFGDKSRPSVSLLFAPLRCANRVNGVFTVQSYTPNAYTEEDLATLQALADHCGNTVERLRVEGLLHRTEELYRRAIGGVGAVPYAYDYRTHSYLFIGEGIEQLTGYTPKEITADLWVRIIKESAMAGEAAGLHKEEAARRVQTGDLRNWRCDMRIVTRDGQSRWISDASVQNLDESDRVIGSMGILEDITERKRSELSALALSKLSQSLILAASPAEVARILAEVADNLFGWDACSFYLYSPERGEVRPVLYMDIINGQRKDVTPSRAFKPSVIDRRVMEKGAELTLREGASLAMNPEAMSFGDSSRPSASIMRVPARLRSKTVSSIIAFHSYTAQAYAHKDLSTLQTMADCCGVALERIWAEADLEQMHRQLLDVSREAGMAEVATSVLHNVGNVLNSVNISCSQISGKVKASRVANLGKAAALLEEHAGDLAAFLSQDPKGKQLPGYLRGLAEHLTGEQQEVLEEIKSLSGNVEHINEIVAMQQSYAKVLGVLESLPLVELVEDALRLHAGALERHGVKVVRQFAEVPPVMVDKHKALQVLINLIRNAKYALDERGHEDKRLTVRIELTENNTAAISITDNGVGISAENLTRIFEHGFTTRKEGHGFALHNGALAAKELGGSLTAASEGPGKGATFTLELPLQSGGVGR